MDYSERIELARMELAEAGETIFEIDDDLSHPDLMAIVLDISVGYARHVVVDMHDNPNALHFVRPSFWSRTWGRTLRRYRTAKLN